MRRVIDILDHWLDRGAITDADYLIGMRVRKVWDDAELSGLAVIRMDVLAPGIAFDNLGHQLDVTTARKAIKRLRPILGLRDKHLMLGALCYGKEIEELALAWNCHGGKKAVSWRIRDGFRTLRVHRWATDQEVFDEEPAPWSERNLAALVIAEALRGIE